MKLGLHTACLPGLPLDEIAAWAAEHTYQALGVATSSATGSRDAAAAHLDVADFDEADADRVRAPFDRHRLELSAFAYHENNLHPDEHRRDEIATHLRHTIDAASLLGGASPTVWRGTPRGPTVGGGTVSPPDRLSRKLALYDPRPVRPAPQTQPRRRPPSPLRSLRHRPGPPALRHPHRDDVERRTSEGKTRREAIRCLQRYVAREIYQTIVPPRSTVPPHQLLLTSIGASNSPSATRRRCWSQP